MMLRWFRPTTAVSLLLGACATEAGDRAPAGSPPPDQIQWQRNLDDALALAKANGLPLLLAVNMDGESASDRVWRERYRDPRFVAWTRHCVCLPASVFRHNARDHDDQGRRIPCPRFGEVTCGEHIALEPVLYEKYLADGDRVAPRHALIRPDGGKAWDLSLCFDLHDIDRALQASVGDGPAPALRAATAHDHAHRLLDEAAWASASGAELRGRLERAAGGEPMAADALLRVVPRLPGGDASLGDAFVAAVRASGLSASIGGELCARLQRPGDEPAAAATATFLAVLRRLDDPSGAFRLFANAQQALSDDGPPSFAGLLAAAQAVTTSGRGVADGTSNAGDAMPEAEALERELAEVERQLAQQRDDAVLLARYAKASLDLARRKIEAGRKDARLLLEDAEMHWRKALARDPSRYESWIERARTAYFLEDYAGELACGRQALSLATGRPLGELPRDATALDARAAEALRWLGDGHARRLADPQGQATDAVREGLLALGLVAASPFGDVKDQVSFASYCRALSCWRAELAAAEAGARRFPAAGEIRACLDQALWQGGVIDLAPAVAARIAEATGAAVAHWFVGQANLLAAEDARRRDDGARAIAAYAAAQAAFERAMAANADYAADCRLRIAGAWLGRGMVAAASPGRGEAVACLERAVAAHRGITTWRDGLGYDALDLVDRILEWREDGPAPLTAAALDATLARVSDDAFWPTAVADAAIREALRADGRNPDRVERDTVDASGKPVRMAMGRATGLGDAWIRDAMAIARRAHGLAGSGLAGGDAATTFAQACTLWAERQLERGRTDEVQAALAAAAAALGMAPVAADAGQEALAAAVAPLRERLGPARPRQREGR